MELRDIEIFLVLAEELHFGRTAERLHVTQARVSQAIKKQERRIGGALFERTNRKVALTPVGQQLFTDLKPVYRDLRESIRRATVAARGKTDLLRLGTLALNIQELRPLLDTFQARHPECDLQIRHIDFGDPFGPLRRGVVDLAIIWLPVREPDLTVGPIVQTEPVLLAMAATHPLAGRSSVSYEDLADQVVMGGATPDYWIESLVPASTPSGRPIRRGPVVTNSAQMFPILSTGEAVSPVHAHSARYLSRPDVAYVPISDAPRAEWALVWRTVVRTDLVAAFVQCAEEVGPVTH